MASHPWWSRTSSSSASPSRIGLRYSSRVASWRRAAPSRCSTPIIRTCEPSCRESATRPDRSREETAMEGNRRTAIVVGAFVLAGLAALALTILSLSSQHGVFRDRYRLVAYFENVQGRIRADSMASIGTIGLLGDRYVEVSIGSEPSPPIASGGELPTVTPTNINLVIDRGAQALENVAKLTNNLNSVVEEFGQATGGRRLAESVGALADVVQQIQEGKGLLHTL